MPRTDRASRLIAAPAESVFAALVDASALETWLPPGDMVGRVLELDPRPGGAFRIVLTYADPAGVRGKSTEDSDVVDATFVEVVPGSRVSYVVTFVSEDPSFAGSMTMTWDLTAVADGTRVDIEAVDVPDGISAEDHATGMSSSLADLARFVERG